MNDKRRRQWHPTPVLLPGKSHDGGAWKAAVHGVAKSWTAERFHFHFSLSCIREGNGNPLQCSCLENPRNRGAWWAAVYRVAQSRTRLKWLSSSRMIKILRITHFLKVLWSSNDLSLKYWWGFPSGLGVKNPTVNAEDASLIPGSGRSPGERNDNPLQYSSWEIPWTKESGGLQFMGSQESNTI